MTTQAPYEDKHSCIVTIRYMFCCHAVFFYPLASSYGDRVLFKSCSACGKDFLCFQTITDLSGFVIFQNIRNRDSDIYYFEIK